MRGDPFERALERGGRIGDLPLAKTQRPYRVPGIRTALPRVQMSCRLEGQLSLERGGGARLIAAREVNQAREPVERHGAEAGVFVLAVLHGDPCRQLALGLVDA